MDINFPLILVCSVFISGFFWLYYKIKLKIIKKNNIENYKPNSFVELCVSIFPVLLIVTIIRSFIIEPYKIPSGSMIPTLEVGDFILVNKFNYGLRLPITGNNIYPTGSPKAGDVMVFKQPGNEKINFIKRVIGVPGDTITYINKTFYINGKKIDKRLINPSGNMLTHFNKFTECFNDTCHNIQTDNNKLNLRAENSWLVPEHMYFVAGDNRDNSHDSRFWGFVPDSNIVGRAFYVWMNWQGFSSLPTFKRNGNIN